MKWSLRKLGPRTAFACEAIGLLALFLAPDVESLIFLVPAALGALAYFARVALRDRLLLLMVALVVLAGYATATSEPTGTLIARALIPAHALLWLAGVESAYRFWRLGIALMEIVLAAILAPEAHMFVVIFFFIVLSSLALALGFIENNFRRRDPESLDRPLKPFFLASVLALSCLMFLSSLIIFPLLPRSQWSGSNTTSAGYNEEVSFKHGIFGWAYQESRPALWVFRQPGQKWESIVPYFLLRGQALENFTGETWRSGARPEPTGVENFAGPIEEIEIARQPMPTDALPVPYGAQQVAPEPRFAPYRSREGEWFVANSSNQSVKYRLAVGGFEKEALGSAPQEATMKFNEIEFPEIAQLAKTLGAGASTDVERILRVRRHFNGYTSELVPVPPVEKGKRHPVEEFLFSTKKGHCELFASSAALLFRALGMPARLVVGFRANPPKRGNVLTVRSSDAHAWVETWQKGRGWVPVDVTPAASSSSWIPDFAGEAYDWLQAYWHRYILDYEFDKAALIGWIKAFMAMALGAALFAFGSREIRRRLRNRAGPREKLARLSEQFEDDLLHIAGIYPKTAYRESSQARNWNARYTELRFGREAPTAKILATMKKEAREIVIKVAQESESAG